MYSSLLEINRHHGPKVASAREKHYHLYQLLLSDLLGFQQLNEPPPTELKWTLHRCCWDCRLMMFPAPHLMSHSELLEEVDDGHPI